MREQNRYATTFYTIGKHSPISGILAGVDMFKQFGTDIIVRSAEKKEEKLQKKKGRRKRKRDGSTSHHLASVPGKNI